MIRTKSMMFIAAALALLLVMPVIAPFGGFALAEVATRQLRTVPEGYNEHDYNKLVAFLEIADENGVKNGEKLNADYDPDDPETWGGTNPYSGNDIFTWEEIDGELRIIALELQAMQLAGNLDLDGCTDLAELFCQINRITDLTVTNCPKLEFLGCGSNRFTTLDVSQNVNLYYLDCSSEIGDGTGIIHSVLLPQTDTLKIFSCYNNRITEIDISCLTGLEFFECALNPLERLDISNNKELVSLSCTDCYLRELIADNPKLTSLYCETNRIETLELRNMDALDMLSCFDNELDTLDLSECPTLTKLSCCYNNLTELDTKNNRMLQLLYCFGNQIRILDFSNNPLLIELKTTEECYEYQYCDNLLTELDLSNCPGFFVDMLRSEGGGNVAFNGNDEYAFLRARQHIGWFFDGWYNADGELVSMKRDFSLSEEYGMVFIAKFIPDGVHVFYGDVDGNGQVTISDAILVLRCSMGIAELDSIQQILADFNADGEIGVSDAIAILRAAMEI